MFQYRIFEETEGEFRGCMGISASLIKMARPSSFTPQIKKEFQEF